MAKKNNGAPALASRRKSRSSATGATRKTVALRQPGKTFSWVNRSLVLVGVLVVLAVSAKAVLVLRAIPVERIVVTGKLENTRTAALQEMVQPALVGGFLSADLQRIRRELESLPWLYEASVRRQWPNALAIHVVEQLPIARWGENGYLNHAGDIFQSEDIAGNSLEHSALPLLTGPEGEQRKLIADYQLLTDMLRPLALPVVALAVDPRGQLRATLADGIELALGDVLLRERLERFVALYRGGLSVRSKEIVRVDVRYPRGIAVAFKEPVELVGL
jgi:cell division protein FtsQ